MRVTDGPARVGGLTVLLCAGAACAAPAPQGQGPQPGPQRMALASGAVYRLHAPPARARGVVLLVGAPPEAALPRLLAARGIATAVPELDRETLYLDGGSMRTMEEVALDALARTGAPPGRVAAGGISLGGTAAVAFAEHCALRRCDFAAQPRAVFAVDAPLDFMRFWRAAVQLTRWDAAGAGAFEARWVLDRLSRQFGGGPEEQRGAYAGRSPFLFDEPNGGLARFLIDTPLRLYAEPDMGFWLDTMGLDYYQLNAFDAAAMGSRLRHQGHRDVEVIMTSGRGFRPDGTRNPHSWSIVDERDLAEWLVARLEGS